MKEIFYQILLLIVIVVTITLAYKHDKRLGNIFAAPLFMIAVGFILLSIFSFVYYLIDANSFQLKHPELYKYIPKTSYKNILLELLGIVSLFCSSFLFFKNITKETHFSWISFIKFLIVFLIGVILILKY